MDRDDLQKIITLCRGYTGEGAVWVQIIKLAAEELLRLMPHNDVIALPASKDAETAAVPLPPFKGSTELARQTPQQILRPEPARAVKEPVCVERQGALIEPNPSGQWDYFFEGCGPFVSGEYIARVLMMDTGTFFRRARECEFPLPRIKGKRGRGYKHEWVTQDVINYLNKYRWGERPPILRERFKRH